MAEMFVPLVKSTSVSAAAPLFNSLTPRNQNASSAATVVENEKCGKPTVTVQKTGEVVSVIRVQCGCGQVTELNCVY